MSDADKDPEGKWHEFTLKAVGAKPMKVSEGQKIHCCTRVANDDCRGCWYGHGGYESNYSILPDQEYDFKTKNSNHNQVGSDENWG